MKLNPLQGIVLASAIGAAIFALVINVGLATAAQPREDSVVLDKDGCDVEVSWVDGLQVSQKITIETIKGAIVTPVQTITLNDIVKDQSEVVATVTAPEGVTVRARLYVDDEVTSEVSTTISKCPTATATPTSTSTPAATSTPLPTMTPVPPIPTPIVIVQTVEVPVVRTIIQPPSTGDGGLLQ